MLVELEGVSRSAEGVKSHGSMSQDFSMASCIASILSPKHHIKLMLMDLLKVNVIFKFVHTSLKLVMGPSRTIQDLFQRSNCLLLILAQF
jgi:hypothetical protein